MINASRIALAVLGLTLAAGTVQAAEWQVDSAHTDVSFKVRHLMVSNTRGRFSDVKGTLVYDEKNPAKSKLTVEIDVASIDTREQKRDDHLRSSDFFDAARYPKITFESTKVKQIGKGQLQVTGHLTLHGVTQTVTLDVEGPTQAVKDPWGNLRRGFTASTKVDRTDFGLTWNKTLEGGGVLVGTDVYITIDVEFMKPAPNDA